jgi:hypothetical protein
MQQDTAVTRLEATSVPNTVHSCRWHGFVAARLTSEWPGSVLPPSTLTLLGVHPYFVTVYTF